jgi:penicillin-binding protein 1A
MTSAYGVFANDGLRLPVRAILKIEDSKGNIIFENNKTPIRVLETNVARLINDVLSDNEARAPMFGPRSNLYFENYQVAAKTGTTDNSRDGWLIGYTTSIVTGIWVGNNDNSPMLKKAAELLAGPIFNKFMKKALLKYPPEKFPKSNL